MGSGTANKNFSIVGEKKNNKVRIEAIGFKQAKAFIDEEQLNRR